MSNFPYTTRPGTASEIIKKYIELREQQGEINLAMTLFDLRDYEKTTNAAYKILSRERKKIAAEIDILINTKIRAVGENE